MTAMSIVSALGGKLLRISLPAVLIAVGVMPSFAWNALGHKVVAEIAWRQLEPVERQRIVDVLRRHPRFDADFAAKMTDDVLRADKVTQDHWIFQHAAYWPDIARGLLGDDRATYNRPTWHYVTNPLFLDTSDRDILALRLGITNSDEYPTDTPKSEYNVLQAIKHCRSALASRGAGADAKALAYCWLFHLVGDIHQPLHSTSLFSVKQFPLGDRGGNGIPLTGGENLHSRWDGLLGRRDLLRNVERQVLELSDRGRYRDAWISSAIKESDPRKWAAESHELCKSVVYSVAILDTVRQSPPGATMSPIRVTTSYMEQAGDVARRRIITAGLRLAALLGAKPTSRTSKVQLPVNNRAVPIPVTSFAPRQLQAAQPQVAMMHWLNTKTDARHNQSCRWYRKTGHGRYCTADEGKPCGQCGG